MPSKYGGCFTYVESGVPGEQLAASARRALRHSSVALEHVARTSRGTSPTSRAARSRRAPPAASARCRAGTPACRRVPCRAARAARSMSIGRRARTRRRAAATRGSSRAPPAGRAPRSCGCPTAPPRRRGSPSSTASDDRLRQRAGVADARRAAVADEVEAELLQVRRHARLVQVVGHHLASRARGCVFTHGFVRQPALDGVLRQQPGGEHHRRVRRVRAARDRRDHDRAVRQRERLRRSSSPARACRAAPVRVGLDVRLAAAAALAQPRRSARRVDAGVLDARASLTRFVRGTTPSRRRERHAVLRPLRPGDARLHVAEIERERVGEQRLGRVVGAEEALLLRVRLDQRDVRVRRGRSAAGTRASRRRPGRSPSSRRTPAPCWRSSRGRAAAGSTARCRRTRRTCRRRPSRAASASR